jgi:hypothetical protein
MRRYSIVDTKSKKVYFSGDSRDLCVKTFHTKVAPLYNSQESQRLQLVDNLFNRYISVRRY